MTKDLIVKTGCMWKGVTWPYAIEQSLVEPDCGIEPIYKQKYPELLLHNEKILTGYQIYGYGNGYRRKYITKVPKRYNDLVKGLLMAKERKEVSK